MDRKAETVKKSTGKMARTEKMQKEDMVECAIAIADVVTDGHPEQEDLVLPDLINEYRAARERWLLAEAMADQEAQEAEWK